MAEWKWAVRCTYNSAAKPPAVPGEIAIETRHQTDTSKDMEVVAASTRGDVDVEVIRLAGDKRFCCRVGAEQHPRPCMWHPDRAGQ